MKLTNLVWLFFGSVASILIGLSMMGELKTIPVGGIDIPYPVLGTIFLVAGGATFGIGIILLIGILLIREAKTPTPVHIDDAPSLEILKQRLVKGEISIEEFNKIKETLEKKA